MTAMILSVLNQKGGVGKTTLAVHIATGLALMGRLVLMVDADKQGSALDWSARRNGKEGRFPVIGLPTPTIHKEIRMLAGPYDVIVIDGPPRTDDVFRSAILASDFIVVPVQPSPYDVWAAKETVDLLREVSVFKENQKRFFVINRKIINTAIGRDVTEALSEYNIPVMKAHVAQRVSFAESANNGLTVLEADPDGLAAHEIRALVNEIMELAKA